MSDPTLRLPIESSFDPKGTDAALAALRKLQQEQVRAQPRSGGDGGAAAQANGYAQLQRAQAGLEAQQARLARTQGDVARAAELEAQAQQRLTTLINAQDVTTTQTIATKRQLVSVEQQVARATQQNTSYAQQFGQAAVSSFTSILGPAALAATAVGAISKGGELIQLGAQADQTRQRFDGLAASAGTTGEALLQALRSASAGTISDLNLELAANRAQLLGVADSAQEFSTLMEIARARAQDMGISTTQAFNDLVTGLGRGSALILDNLGITVSVTEANKAFADQLGKNVSALTEAEQKQALINAVLVQGKASLDAAGGAAETNAQKLERFTAQSENIKAAFGGELLGVVGPFVDLLGRVGSAATAAGDGAKSGGADVQAFKERVQESIPVLGGFFIAVHDLRDGLAQIGIGGAQAAPSLDATAQAAVQATAATQALIPPVQMSAAALEIQAQANAQAAEMHRQGEREARAFSVATQDATAASLADSYAKQEQAAQTELLAAQNQYAVDQFLQLNPNIDASGAASIVAAQNMDPLIAQLIIAAVRARDARNELAAFNALAGISAAQAQSDFRAGERSGGRVRTLAEERAEADRLAQIQRNQARTAQEQLQADLAIARAKGDQKAQIDLLRQSQKGLIAGSSEYKNVEAQILSLQRQSARGAGSGGRAGGGSAASRAKAAEQTATRLVDIERAGGNKIAEINEQTQAKIAAIEKKYADQRARQQRELMDEIARTNASTDLDQQLNDFDQFNKDLTDDQRAALAEREKAEADYNAKVAQYQEEARQQAATGDAELAKETLAARTKQAEEEKRIAERAAEARRQGGDAAAVAKEAQEATAAAQREADTAIAIAQAKAQERAGAEQAEKDAVIAAAQEQAAKVIGAAEDQAAKVKGASDSQKATVIANLQAQAAAVKAWADTIVGEAGRAGSAMAGVTGPPTAPGEEGGGEAGATGGGASLAGGQGLRAGGGRSAGGSGGTVEAAIQTLNDAAEIIKVIKPFVASNRGAVKLLNEYSLTVKSAVASLIAIRDLRERLVAPAPVLDVNQVLQLKADIERVLTLMMSIDASATSKVRVFAKYLETEKAAVDILNTVMELRKALSEPTPPISPEYVLTLIATANAVIGLLFSQLIPLKQREVDGLKTYADAAGAGVGMLRDVADLRKDLSDQAGVAPFNMALIQGLVRRAAEITRLVQDQLVPLTEAQATGFESYATAAGASIEILRGTAELRKDLAAQKDVSPFDMALIKGLAMRARQITELVLAQLVPLTEAQADAFDRYAAAAGGAIDILSGTADLRKTLSEAPPGAIDLRIVRALAADAQAVTGVVLSQTIPATEEEVAALQRYADSQGAAVSVVKETAELRKDLAEGVGPPIDVRAIERIADDAQRITEIVLQRALPASEETAEAAQRYQETAGAAIETIKNTLGLTSDLFANYVSPSDAQLDRIVTDSARIVGAVARAAAVFDTEGLAAAKAFGEANGAIVGSFLETLRFNEALLFGPALAPDQEKLAEFEKGMGATIATAARLGAQASAIPAGDIAALQAATAANTAAYDSLLKLSTLPGGNLGDLAQAYGGLGGGGSMTVNITINTLPGQNAQQIAQMAVSQINQQWRSHR